MNSFFIVILNIIFVLTIADITSPKEFLDRYMHLVDKERDANKWAKEMFLENGTFAIGNFPVSTGWEQIAGAAQGIFDVTAKIEHVTTAFYTPTSGKNIII
jgi:hypothetical protein